MNKLEDLTIIYITANLLPKEWVQFQMEHFAKASKGASIISVSRVPCSLGVNIIDDAPETSYWNIYHQLLRACIRAQTEYVATAEDDTLYSREHYTQFRPRADEVSYNRSRWSLFWWDNIYSLKQRVSNCSLIAPRDYLISALEEREKKWPHGAPNNMTGEVGRSVIERRLRVKRRHMAEWYSTVPIIHLNHPYGSDDAAARGHKTHGQLKAFDIPYWGKAVDILKHLPTHATR